LPTPKASTFANHYKSTHRPKFAKELALPTKKEKQKNSLASQKSNQPTHDPTDRKSGLKTD